MTFIITEFIHQAMKHLSILGSLTAGELWRNDEHLLFLIVAEKYFRLEIQLFK